ncbi:MAG: hypothetical protein ACR2I0_05375, partial [Rhodoferax sp.]
MMRSTHTPPSRNGPARWRSWLALLGAVSACAALAQELPKAAVRPVEEVFFGTRVSDPYRYFENLKDPEVAHWIKAHSEHAFGVLNRINGRDALLAQLTAYDEATAARVGSATRTSNGLWFYEKRGAKDNQFKLMVRQGLDGPEQLLVDPGAIEKRSGKPHAINYFAPSPDGRYVAYGLSKQGSESASLYVLDVKRGRTLGKPISRADFGSPDWAPDSRSLHFVRLQALRPGMPETEKYQRAAVYRLDVARGRLAAQPAFDYRSAGVDMTPAEIPFLTTTHDGHWMLGVAANGTQRELKAFIAPAQDVLRGKARWQRVVDTSDEVTGITYMNDALYLLSHKDAPRFAIKRLDLPARATAAAEVVVAQSQRVLTGIAAASDALYVEARDGNVKRLAKLGYH